jgi:hypothetical protein
MGNTTTLSGLSEIRGCAFDFGVLRISAAFFRSIKTFYWIFSVWTLYFGIDVLKARPTDLAAGPDRWVTQCHTRVINTEIGMVYLKGPVDRSVRRARQMGHTQPSCLACPKSEAAPLISGF